MIPYFPIVGIVLGILVALFDYVALRVWGKTVAVLLDVVFLIVLTGAFLIDGLGDSADGLMGHRPKENVLTIMKDSRLGTMGLVAILVGLSVKWAGIDDIVNYIPARLSVPIISLASGFLSARGLRSFQTAIEEGAHHTSPNAGYAEAAFAGALGVKLNGPNYYHGQLVDKPYIGIRFGGTNPGHIKQACDLMLLAAVLWLMLMTSAGVAIA